MTAAQTRENAEFPASSSQESNFRKLASQLVGGKPIWLYATGQTVNIVLTLAVAWLAFG